LSRRTGQGVPERLLTNSEMKAADEAAIAAGTPGIVLMERAGEAIARTAGELLSSRGRVLVLCGPGNNGGDGFAAARLLAERGYSVRLALLGTRERLKGDAALAAEAWSGAVSRAEEVDPAEHDLVVDALFGAGLERDVTGEAAALVERVNGSGRPVLAVDVPSGLDGDIGQVRGTAIRATQTVTFVTRKPGHLILPGRALSGPVEVADIGIGPEIVEKVGGATWANGPDLWRARFPRLSLEAHKYTRGHTLVASGGATRTGAARLAARAALRIGSGLVTLASPPEALGVNAAQLTAIMLRGYDGPESFGRILEDARFGAVVLGPALGVHAMTRALVGVAVQARRALVLDADALTSFEGAAADLGAYFRNAVAVLTPHAGEFSRMFSGQAGILETPSKLHAARAAARFTGATIVYKGPDTVVAAPDGRAAINENGTPDLATAGTGDVLSGLIGGLMAQGMPAFEAACAGVWIHAEAGARFGPGLIAEDLPELVPSVLRELLR
jgi:hydroxyethylthiazole kinase-like uncharacterized protein yjeF